MLTPGKQTRQAAIVAAIVDGNRIVINKGSADGVECGHRYLIFRLGDEIADPVTKATLGRLEIVKGTGKAVHVQEHLTTLESDRVRRPTPVVRTIRRGPAVLMGLYGDETVEESRESESLGFDDPKVGDNARPI